MHGFQDNSAYRPPITNAHLQRVFDCNEVVQTQRSFSPKDNVCFNILRLDYYHTPKPKRKKPILAFRSFFLAFSSLKHKRKLKTAFPLLKLIIHEP